MSSERPTEAEFNELKRKRNEGIMQMVRKARKSIWPDEPDDALLTFHCRDYLAECYCNCPEGPCQHEFTGWRDIHNDDGEVCGGEQFCKRCGMGAMNHSMMCGP